MAVKLRTIYLRFVLAFVILAALLFLSAGRIDLPMFWAYLATLALFSFTVIFLVGRRDPGLIQERVKPGPGARDPETRRLLVPCIFGHLIVAGLDVGRYHWSDSVPLPVQTIALVVFALGLAGWFWAMSNNPFFSSEVRIQSERGHHVVSGGPYRFVRHPGYAALIPWLLASPLVLGSWWAGVPTVGAVALIIRRTVIEDHILRAELPGYVEYAARVRFRLLPGVW